MNRKAILQRVLTVLRKFGAGHRDYRRSPTRLWGIATRREILAPSGRVFSMIAQQMGDTRYRGRIMWMLLTCRPDLLPIDLKRQGRAEVHIPLFYPDNEAEIREMFKVMGRKNDVAIDPDAITLDDRHKELSGADIERRGPDGSESCFGRWADTVTKEDIEQSLSEFIPSAQGLEKDMQEVARRSGMYSDGLPELRMAGRFGI